MKLPTNGNQRILIGILPALFLTDDFLCMATTGGVFHTRTTGLFRGGSHHQGSCPQRPGSGHARVPAPDHLLGALHFLAENLHQLVGGFLQSNGAKEDLKKITCDCACCRPLLPKAYRNSILRAVSRVGRRFPPPSKNARRYDGSKTLELPNCECLADVFLHGFNRVARAGREMDSHLLAEME